MKYSQKLNNKKTTTTTTEIEQRSEQIHYQRDMDDKKKYKEIIEIISHQGNRNQNNNELSLHTLEWQKLEGDYTKFGMNVKEL